jgi:hypothetical protein
MAAFKNSGARAKVGFGVARQRARRADSGSSPEGVHFTGPHGNGREVPKAVITFPSFEPPCALDSLCPDAAFAEHSTTTSSGKPARGALEQTELCQTIRSRSKRAPLRMAGAATPASNEKPIALYSNGFEDIFAKYPIATS